MWSGLCVYIEVQVIPVPNLLQPAHFQGRRIPNIAKGVLGKKLIDIERKIIWYRHRRECVDCRSCRLNVCGRRYLCQRDSGCRRGRKLIYGWCGRWCRRGCLSLALAGWRVARKLWCGQYELEEEVVRCCSQFRRQAKLVQHL